MSPSETVLFWTEYVLRHNGTAHMRSEALDVPLHQYLLLDLIVFFLIFVILIGYLVYSLKKLLISSQVVR